MSAPPPSLPPLPALVQRSQTRPHDREVAPLVPPLRWRSQPESAATPPARSFDLGRFLVDEASSSDSQEEQQRSKKMMKRQRGTAPQHRYGDDLDRGKKPGTQRRRGRDELDQEVRALEAEIATLRRQAGLPTAEDMDVADEIKALNFNVEEKLHQNDRFLGHLHSMATTNWYLLPAVNTMSTFIHLPRDMAPRRAILRNMQELSLRRGIEVMCAWLHHLDATAPYISEERFTSATGEYHCHRLELHQFPNFRSARDVYVYVKFVHELEFSVTETLGQLTLREDTNDFDPTIWNHRILTVAEDVGVPEELNVVGFSRFYDHSPHTGTPMGVVVHDTVNIDDLFPYQPDERVCKDVQAVLMVYETRAPDSGETVVVIKQASFIVQLTPQFPVEPRALQQLHANCTRWPDSIMKYLHEYGGEKPQSSADDSEETKSAD